MRDQDIDNMIARYPQLRVCYKEIYRVYKTICNSFETGHKLLICGNGGSCADSQHIVGELMKSFMIPRNMLEEDRRRLIEVYGDNGVIMSEKLEKGLPAISIDSMPVISSAISNDIDSDYVYAQVLYNYGIEGDVLLGISTSGNAVNVNHALKLAKILGIKTVGLTGNNGGKMNKVCDEVIHAPSDVTYEIQEYHISIYHTLCIMVEKYFFL